MSQHHATFTWGAGPDSVHIAGGFNNWSATASPLHKQSDGTFKADLPVPWGEKQAFKYVVDGEWKVREDEAKEWDAAGNMNNVYTAPPAPQAEHPHEHSSGKAAAIASAPVAAAAAAVKSSDHDAVSRAPEPAPVPAIAKAEPSNLMAASAPSAASNPLFSLGKPVSEVKHADMPLADTKFVDPAGVPTTVHTSAAPIVHSSPTPAAPVAIAPIGQSLTPAETLEKTAAHANVGEATNGPHEESILEKASAIGATALAGIGAYVGVAAGAVEKVTGIDLSHGNPLTIEEAKAKGLDLNEIQKRDAETDAVSPVGTKPPTAAVDDLARKVEDLKVGSKLESPNADAKTNDIPAQSETKDNHKTVPMPVITAISERDPKKDRTLESPTAGSAAKPIGTDPSISAKVAKVESEQNPGKNAATLSQAHAANGTATQPVKGPAATGPLAAGTAAVSPDRPSTNPAATAPAPVKKDTSGINTAPTSSLGQAPEVKSAVVPVTAPAPVAAAAPVPATSSAIPPTTPKKNPILDQAQTPGSLNSTPASTPVKSAHQKESTGGSDVRKRKSSFFHKLKTAFSPKDKEKK